MRFVPVPPIHNCEVPGHEQLTIRDLDTTSLGPQTSVSRVSQRAAALCLTPFVVDARSPAAAPASPCGLFVREGYQYDYVLDGESGGQRPSTAGKAPAKSTEPSSAKKTAAKSPASDWPNSAWL
ncbi:hypothetical protein FS749_007937 [Ceratobasidium sp. UAMH 11750]|nr:hypothetical protein FS749_007937 [Ceratobasidium sp. UAMH 11750]